MQSQFYLSATRKSSGKTTLSIGLSAALTALGKSVQCFKKGPDYIDPIWLSKASGQATYNLDFNTQTDNEMQNTYAQHCQGQDVALIEGNKGLFDGVATDGSNSNAALAKLLDIPVLLVVDCQGMSRGIAPLLQGYLGFDDGINYAGVILNKTGGSRHEQKLQQAIKEYTDLTVFGCLGRRSFLTIEERHLGLIPANETGNANDIIQSTCELVTQHIDLSTLLHKTQKPVTEWQLKPSLKKRYDGLRIAIAKDSAFGFYYADDLQYMQNAGVEIKYFNSQSDSQLPEADGLFIGGGFPETHSRTLSANKSLRQNIKTTIENGLPTYAECGGLMYLCQDITTNNETHEMVGAIAANIIMHRKPQGRGYCEYTPLANHPWSDFATHNSKLKAHEFHYAQMHNFNADKFAYQVNRGYGINGTDDGLIAHNLLANFVHLRHTESCPWIDYFLNFVQEHKQS